VTERDADRRLEELLAECYECIEAGQSPDFERYRATDPDLVPQLESFFRDEEDDRDFGRQKKALDEYAAAAETGAPSATPRPERGGPVRVGDVLGDYEVVAPIARGGMGAVFRARQRSLPREVALKVLLDDGDAERFRNEAQLAAKLHHDTIVSIYEVGAHHGRPYIVMALADGGTLRDRLAAGPLPPREAAELLRPVCEAVAHAHANGVLHRDLKPSNVLLDGGRPRVADFGLAKGVAVDDPALTRSGDLVGTPRYMAPEQARGTPVGPRADVYALGAILYECLTGRPPFQAPGVLDTLRQVIDQDPVPPRRLVPGVPRDLETVCLKCLEKDAARRYASASALADDLTNYLEHRPVKARPAGPARRLVKWSRRHPALSATAVAGLLVVGLLAAFGLHLRAKNVELEGSNDQVRRHAERVEAAGVTIAKQRDDLAAANTEVTAQRDKVLASLRLGRGVIKQFYVRMSRNPRLRNYDLEALRADLLREAVAGYETLAKQGGDLPELRFERGQALGMLGQIRGELGEHAAAVGHLRDALGVFAKLDAEAPGNRDYRRALALTLGELGLALGRSGDQAGAEAEHREALKGFAELAAEPGATTDDLLSEAGAHGNLANLCQHTGRPDMALAEYTEALKLGRKAGTREPARRNLAATLHNLGLFHQHRGELKRAEELEGEAEDLRRGLRREEERETAHAEELADGLLNRSSLYADTGRPDEALKALDEAADLLGKLADEHPAVPGYRAGLARVLNNRGILLTDLGRPGADRAFERALELRRKLVDAYPAAHAWREDLAASLHNLARWHDDAGRSGPAAAVVREALAIREALVKQHPQVVEYRKSLAVTRRAAADHEKDVGRAKALYGKALELQKRLIEEFPNVPEHTVELTKTLNNLGGRENLIESLRLRQELVRRFPGIAEYESLLAGAHDRLATDWYADDLKEAEKHYHDALVIRERLAQAHQNVPQHWADLARNCDNLGLVLARTDRHGPAEEYFTRGVKLFEPLAAADGSPANYRRDLAHLLTNRGVFFSQTRRFDLANADYLKAIGQYESLVKLDPDRTDWTSSLGLACDNLARLLRRKDPAEALKLHEKAMAVLEELFRHEPSNNVRARLAQARAEQALTLCVNERPRDSLPHWERAIALNDGTDSVPWRLNYFEALARAGEHARAFAEVEKVATVPDVPAGIVYRLAQVLAQAAAAAGADAKLSPAERERQATRCADKALALLKRVEGADFFRYPEELAHLKTGAEFAPLRPRPEFKALLERVSKGK
jgi:tetratricopeptide (TPR) repeat protein/tRNA A-37 threonylcarbamoyl transferase component Bud32